MRVLVTGAGGGLGRALQERAGGSYELIPFDHRALDVEDREATRSTVTGVKPEVVVHAAAMTSVDGCQTDPVGAYRANALGTRNVALACRETGALLLALSTDYVFDGEKGEPYHEFDDPRPISVYGSSKLAGEREAALAADHVIVRTSWVFGGGRDFLTSALQRLAAGEDVPAIADLAGTPTFVGYLAERLLLLVEEGLRGVVHLGGGRPTSWYDLLLDAKDRFDLPGRVTPQKAEELGRPAPRPRSSALTTLVLPAEGPLAMPPLLDGVAQVLEGIDGRP